MRNRSSTSLLGAAVALVLVLVVFILGGYIIRQLITGAFDNTTQVRSMLSMARTTLILQLDEETGVRGFDAANQRLYLRPYDEARRRLPALLAQLHATLVAQDLPEIAAVVQDAAETNRLWMTAVGRPLAGELPDPRPDGTELAGKTLVDHFRADYALIDAALAQQLEQRADALRFAIDRINLLVGLTALGIAVAGVLFLDYQRRATERSEAERRLSESIRRDTDMLRAAYAAEKRIADTLQDAIAQRPLPLLPTLRFSATYVPATEETKVGGDWYDALELPNDRVLFAIGDVTGHGIEAAVTMNRARQALISSALLEGDPAAVLQRVNDEMFRQNAPLVTAVAGFADASTYEFIYAIAGHPPPLLIEPGRAPRLLDCGSLPLGALRGTDYQLHRVQSVPGATLVLYTDGAVEHSHDVLEGEELLIAAASGAAEANAADPATFIHEAIFRNRPVGDDVAILTIGFTTEPTTTLRISADDAQSAFTGRIGRPATAGMRTSGQRARVTWPERYAS